MKRLSLDVGTVSDVGKVRDVNQDRIFAGKSIYKKSDCGMFVVADGIGGMEQGEKSSSIAVSCLAEHWDKLTEVAAKKISLSATFIEKSIAEAFFYANDEILKYGHQMDIRLGTTLSLLLILKNSFFIAHAGDSRIYRIRGNKIELLTQDQTWAAQQVGKNLMTWEQAMNHPDGNKLCGCIGVYENPVIFTTSGKIKQNDVFLICSDGFYRFISHDEISEILSKSMPLQQAVLEMLDKVMERKASDNISAILVRSL